MYHGLCITDYVSRIMYHESWIVLCIVLYCIVLYCIVYYVSRVLLCKPQGPRPGAGSTIEERRQHAFKAEKSKRRAACRTAMRLLSRVLLPLLSHPTSASAKRSTNAHVNVMMMSRVNSDPAGGAMAAFGRSKEDRDAAAQLARTARKIAVSVRAYAER